MADVVITKQELIDAQKDAKTLEDVINGAANIQVTARLGRTFWTLATLNSKLNSVETAATQAIASMNLKVAGVEAAATQGLININNDVASVETARVVAESQMNAKVASVEQIFDNKLSEWDGEAQTEINEWRSAIALITQEDGIPDLAVSTWSGRTQADKNKDFVSVKDYGAIGDGIADDSNAIQLAINTTKPNSTLYLPRGIYRITKALKWKTKLSLIGEGAGSSVLKMDGVLFSAIENLSQGSTGGGDENTVPLEDCRFEDFEIDGSGLTSTTASTQGKGIFILYLRRSIFRGLYIHHTIGTGLGCDFMESCVVDSCVVEYCGRNIAEGSSTIGQSGIGIGTGWKESESLVVSNCFTNFNGNFGIFVEIQTPSTKDFRPQGAKITGCYARGNRVGISNRGSGGTMISNCHSLENQFDGFRITNSDFSYNQLSNCRSEDNGEHGFKFERVGGMDSISDCIAYRNEGCGLYVYSNIYDPNTIEGKGFNISNFTSRLSGDKGIYMVHNGTTDVIGVTKLDNVVVVDSASDGIYISRYENLSVSNTSVHTSEGVGFVADGVKDMSLSGVALKDNNGDGASIQYPVNLKVSNSVISGNFGDGVILKSIQNGYDIAFAGNSISNNGKSGITNVTMVSNSNGFLTIGGCQIYGNGTRNSANFNHGIDISVYNGVGKIHNNIITDTKIEKTQSTGIKLTRPTGSVGKFIINDNFVDGNKGVPVNVVGNSDVIVRGNTGFPVQEVIVKTISTSPTTLNATSYDRVIYAKGTNVSVKIGSSPYAISGDDLTVYVPALSTATLEFTGTLVYREQAM